MQTKIEDFQGVLKDPVFKYIFSHKEILKDFLDIILNILETLEGL